MPKPDPKLKTRYETTDPDYDPGSADVSSEQSRLQPGRKTKTISVSDNSETPEKSIILNPNSPHQEEIVTIDLINSPDDSSNNFTKPNILFSQAQKTPIKMDAEQIRQIIATVLATQTESEKVRSIVPKVDLQKLTMTNYVDWAKKMKYALMLNKLWVDPTENPAQLSIENKDKNSRAILFMACYLDDQNASFINDSNEKCFISAWNAIKKFHQPRSATVLTDIHRQIQSIKHVPGTSIESHLMKLEAQFARFHDIEKVLAEEHLVAFILASVSDSSDFTNVFHSAMWEDESSLTIAKVKSVLISTQRRQKSGANEEAHYSKFKPKSSNFNPRPALKRHNRRPNDPNSGWRCPVCEMDNHTIENCFRKTSKSSENRNKANSKRANQVEEETETVNVATAYAGASTQFHRVEPYGTTHRPAESAQPSVRDRLGEIVQATSPYQNILPTRLTTEDDILDINFSPDYEVDFMNYNSPPPSPLLKRSGENKNSTVNKNSSSIYSQAITERLETTPSLGPEPKEYFTSSRHHINRCMNHFNILNLQKFYQQSNFNAFCSQKLNSNKTILNSKTERVFIVDSGATLHMCNSQDILSNFTPQTGQNVIISDGSKIPIHGYGTLTIFLKDVANNSLHKLTLNQVAVVPKLSVNLISVRALTSSGVSIKFTNESCYIQHPNATILLAKISNSSYTFKMAIQKNISDQDQKSFSCVHQWHRKLGHRNLAHIKKVQKALNLNIEKCNCSDECLGCLKGKFHALPFPQKSEKPILPREIITTDVCGPFRTSSIGGSKYFVTFTCATTDYTEVAAIKSKSDCKKHLINYVQKCKNQFGTCPKIIRSDRGGEYIDEELQSFLSSNGIIFQCTVPRCPQQNGISERKNRTLLEGIRSMLLTKDLPKFLWAEALHHANETYNNIPKDSDFPSPKSQFFDKIFNHKFIEFGTPVFYTTNPLNRSKLDERGASGIFVGLDRNSKGFRVFSDGKIRIERNIKFLNSSNTHPEINKLPTNVQDDLTEDADTQIIPTTLPRRSKRIQEKQAHSADVYEPKTYKQAITCKEKDKWVFAMEAELNSIKENNTWTEVELPKNRTAIGCRWVYKLKRNEAEDKTRYKARLVAQGYTQKFGVDFDEIFAPVTRSSTFRTLLAVASARNLFVKQFDVKSAFLNGSLQEEIYMKKPPGSPETNKVLRLHKSLYGLKQAARAWNQTLTAAMTNEGFKQSKHDECLFIHKSKSDTCYAIVHVDDMIFSSQSESLINSKIMSLNKYFELKCLGNVQNYLGIEVSRDENGIFAISQTNYIQKVSSEFGLEDSKGSKYPLAPGYHSMEDSQTLESNNEYRKLIGQLLYISTNTRPDISAAVGILAQRVSKPRELDLIEAKRIIKYLMSTKTEKLCMLDKSSSTTLTAFADSDWAEDRETRKSISGVICKVFGASVSWSSRKQDVVSTSTTESEFYAIAETVKEIQWLKNILNDFHVNVKEPITIFSDNQSTIKLIENSKFSSRTKHIDVRLHFVRECVREGKIILKYCPSEDNIADLLTKPLAGVKMKYLRNLAALRD